LELTQAWRLCVESFTAKAFDGEGAARTEGRWNLRAVRVVYTAETLALAAMEFFVNLSLRRPLALAAIPVEIPDVVEIVSLDSAGLPSDWRTHPAAPSTRAIGSAWIAAARSAVLSVPSALIPQERNYLLNPAHRDFHKIRIGKPEPFYFDPRMWK
jgi:RES domain-containing protein